ncbi:hypothetical protein [Tepidiphilus sp. J10]|uniref:hypothetical protein n=1 Tax=Tepidiphilus sp. J10 TaxID=2502185 RepID=UPI00115E42C4|nr:hypothetical protein [Tepidiphilus sp. J10]
MLERDTQWRQGDVLTCESAAALNLIDTADGGARVIVITHDCDLPHKDEPEVELIVAKAVERIDPLYTYAKNPRRLHLAYEVARQGSPLFLELRQSHRRSVPKADFSQWARQDTSIVLPIDAKRILKQWLAARYGRPAFPNEFERRLRKGNLERKIAKILQPDAQYLIGLFFDLGQQRGIEAPEGEPYALSISVVYDTAKGVDVRRLAEQAATKLRTLFEQVYGKAEVASEIALDHCEAVADISMTLADLRRVDQWRLESLSLQDEDQGDFLAVGEMPV